MGKKTQKKGKKSKNNRNNNCDNVLLSKNERKILFKKLNDVNWCDEDDVWDFAVELGRLSVQLRSEILSHDDEG